MVTPPPVPPGPRDRVFGFSLARKFAADPLKFLADVGHEYGDLSHFRIGPIHAYLVNHPDLIREVLVTRARQFRKQPRTLDALRKIDGEGLVISEGEFWSRQRRLLQPAFHPRRMPTYAETIVERTTRFLKGWTPGTVVDVAQEMTHLTVQIISRLFFGLELDEQAARLGDAVRTLSITIYQELGSLVSLPDWTPTPAKRQKRRAIATIDSLIRQTIRERRASGDDRGDLLSMLLMALDDEGDGRGMTDEQVRDEAVTMFNAGHDSTAAALAWIFFLLAEHPMAEAKLRDEFRATLGDRAPRFEDVARLPYAEMVVREALRLYPPVWTLFVRTPVEELTLGGFPIRKGAWIYILPWVTQRDGRFFPDPLRFDPERFSPLRVGAVPQYAWLPFGAGPHACIGQALAMTEMALILATVMQRFRLSLASDQGPVVPEPLLAIRPLGGLKMRLQANHGTAP